MPIIAQDIINRVNLITIDRHNTRWAVPELLSWLTDGARAIAVVRPAATAKNATFQFAAGSKQAIPADGWTLIDLPRNMGTDGSTPGRAITPTSRKDMDAFWPNWHAERQAKEIQHFMLDERDPKVFYVYPPADGTTRADIVYSSSVPQLSDAADELPIDPVYVPALVDYVLYRAYSKDADFSANSARAVAHYQAFGEALGIATQNTAQYSPNTKVAEG